MQMNAQLTNKNVTASINLIFHWLTSREYLFMNNLSQTNTTKTNQMLSLNDKNKIYLCISRFLWTMNIFAQNVVNVNCVITSISSQCLFKWLWIYKPQRILISGKTTLHKTKMQYFQFTRNLLSETIQVWSYLGNEIYTSDCLITTIWWQTFLMEKV